MASYVDVLFYSLLGGVFSLVGGILLLGYKKTADTLAMYATPFAAGALLAAAFVEMVPESMHDLSPSTASQWILGGIVAFFMLEYFFHWFHHHHEHASEKRTPAPLIIIGDTLHNLLDGVAIGAAFLIDTPTGIVTAIAVAVHEIPQEIGDFGLLLKFGFARRRVIAINVISALASTVGALVTFGLGSNSELPTSGLLAATAGMFIYIAASDLIPVIHEEAKKKTNHLAAILLLAGILSITISTSLAHNFLPGEAHHEAESQSHLEE